MGAARFMRYRRTLAAIATGATLAAASNDASAITFNAVYQDSAGEGFYDASLGAARRSAFEYALGLWGNLLAPSYAGETINVEASFNPLGGTTTSATLGQAGAKYISYSGGVGYVEPLLNHLLEADDYPDNEIISFFNSDVDNSTVLGSTDWYYGTNQTPGFDADFVSVVLHEVGHGLGFSSRINGSTGAYATGPSVYDLFLERLDGTDLTALSTGDRLAAITSGNVYWNGAFGIAANGGIRPRIFAPSPYEPGSSISHLDETVHTFELMSPYYSGADHTPGSLALGMLADMGWDVVPEPTAAALLGVGALVLVGRRRAA